ncbi:MAG: DNA polymerase III subunit delta [Gammaproteobacteria bacterium]|nr:DNA polymerase III subunit delta [Gammaproteobacteria bacterium]
MKTRVEALPEQLRRGLATLYYVSGDEPFQRDQACEWIRRAAHQQGYTERQVLHVERGFDWQWVLRASDNLCLFAERKIVELRLGATKPNAEAGKVLQHLVTNPLADTLVLIVGDKLEAAQQRSAWFSAIEQQGVVVQVWPLEANRLIPWLVQRLKHRGMQAQPQALQQLADHVEGNLLAAEQEIEKLFLVWGAVTLTAEQVCAAVADSARFDLFSLSDEALGGDGARATRILFGLKSEGVDPVLILWALAREVRTLARLAEHQAKGDTVEQILTHESIWEKRKPLLRAALKRTKVTDWQGYLCQCAHVDRVIKGQASGRAWDELLKLTLGLAGVPALRFTG